MLAALNGAVEGGLFSWYEAHTRADLQYPQRVTSRWEGRPATLGAFLMLAESELT